MAKKTKKKAPNTLEEAYEEFFTPHPLPYQGIYTDADSLEQPSPLKFFYTTATPAVPAVDPVPVRIHAQLDRDI